MNSNGQISQTLNGGDTWSIKKFIDPNLKGFPYLRCMGWASEKNGWVGAVTVFDAGTKDYLKVLFHRTTDGGATWDNIANMPDSSPAGICGMFAVNENIVYGAGTNDPNLPGPGLVKTTNGGATWTHTDLSQHADNLIDVYFSDENTGWIVGGRKDPSCPKVKPGYETHPQYSQLKPVVLKTMDGGATWVNKAAGVAGMVVGRQSASVCLSRQGGTPYCRRNGLEMSLGPDQTNWYLQGIRRAEQDGLIDYARKN